MIFRAFLLIVCLSQSLFPTLPPKYTAQICAATCNVQNLQERITLQKNLGKFVQRVLKLNPRALYSAKEYVLPAYEASGTFAHIFYLDEDRNLKVKTIRRFKPFRITLYNGAIILGSYILNIDQGSRRFERNPHVILAGEFANLISQDLAALHSGIRRVLGYI